MLDLTKNPRKFSIQFVFAKLGAEIRNEIIHKQVVRKPNTAKPTQIENEFKNDNI